jgi:oligopeptide/dipeptide ABC transporter ATP-binding protein
VPILLEVDGLTTQILRGGEPSRVVDGVSFAIEKGESVGLVGESGSGKSMTAYSILGLLPPNAQIVAGDIRFNGRSLMALDANEMRQIRGRDISIVLQDAMSALNPVIPIGEQIADALEAHVKVSRRESWSRATEMLTQLGIADAARWMPRFAHELSGGMQQRTLIAAALITSPQLIIADEPTTALDVTVQRQILALLAAAQDERNTAILLISHDVASVASLCDRILVMYAGQIVESGPTKDVLSAPQHPYTQGLLASVPEITGPSRYLNAIPGAPPDPAMLPSGCRFAPRCPYVSDVCLEKIPDLVSAGPDWDARCVLVGSIR